ncbi:uncharacterized protein LOC142351033 isoform X2 [Convolutriloba macropyga]|uniref:uncharacterized protein LOC142351033 isoform X2 n=1 Tax=Convolutriloba macropyga TaxID=536237 RepID=UPI003F524E04
MVLTIHLRLLLFFIAIFFHEKSCRASIQDNEKSTKCRSFQWIDDELISDICYNHANMHLFMDNKNLSTIDTQFVSRLLHGVYTGSDLSAANFARFFCAATFDICVTEKNSTADMNDSSVQIVPPCRSLCKSAQKTYMDYRRHDEEMEMMFEDCNDFPRPKDVNRLCVPPFFYDFE